MALASICGYSSDSNSEEETEREKSSTTSTGKSAAGSEASTARARNFFASESTSDTDSSQSDDDQNEQPSSTNLQSTKKETLLLPSIDFRQKKTVASIFNNPFREAEEKQFSVLEQHVNLTEGVPEEESNRIPCKAFRRGNCKRGNRCRFSHVLRGGQLANRPRSPDQDSDPNQNPKTYVSEPIRYKKKKIAEDVLPGGFISQTGFDKGVNSRDEGFVNEAEFDQGEGRSDKRRSSPDRDEKPKRKKIGVTDSLVPPKRALADFKRSKH